MAEFDDIVKRYTQQPSTSSGAAVPQSNFGDILKRYGAPAPSTPPSVSQVIVQNPDGTTDVIRDASKDNPSSSLAGLREGMVIEPLLAANRAAQFVTEAVPPIGSVYKKILGDPGATAQAAEKERAAYNEKYKDDAAAERARIAGGTAITLPAAGIANAAIRNIPRIGSFLAGEAGEGLAARLASRLVGGAQQGAIGAAASSGQSNEPLVNDLTQGATFGAVPNVLLSGPARMAQRVSLPSEVAKLADEAINTYGLTALRPADISQKYWVRKADQMTGRMPFSGAEEDRANLLDQYTQAALRTIGVDGTRASDDVLAKARTTIGKQIGDAENNMLIDFRNTNLLTDISDVANRALGASGLADSEKAAVTKLIKQIIDPIQQQGGVTTGIPVGNMFHKGSPFDSALKSPNANVRYFAGELEDAVRDAAAQSLPPGEYQAYQQLRGMYKNVNTLAKTKIDSSGHIIPSALETAVTSQAGGKPNRVFYPQGDLGRLAKIGRAFGVEPADSGTPMGTMILNALTAPSTLVAGAVGGHFALPLPEALAMGAGAATSGAVGRIARVPLNSSLLRDVQIRQGLRDDPGFVNNALSLGYRYVPAAAGGYATRPEVTSGETQ